MTRSDTIQPPTPQTVTLVGRFLQLSANHAVRFAWPNSAMGFTFEGDAINVVLAEDAVRSVGREQVHNMYEVVVDGQVMSPITVTSTAPQSFAVTGGLFAGPHVVWIIKRTEGMVGSGVFVGFDVPEGTRLLAPPPPRERRIEVYGASNEAGYGNLGKATAKNMCSYSPNTQNAAVAYPALVARAFDADLVNISFSGKGMVGTCTPGDLEPLPALAERIEPFYPKVWQDNAAQAPQVVLVTLGANDFGMKTPDKAAFHGAYGAFLRKLRKRYPEAYIICTVTPMMGEQPRAIYKSWMTQIVADVHDTKVSLLEFPAYTGSTFGCDSHPDEALHEALAAQLHARIQALTGWQ